MKNTILVTLALLAAYALGTVHGAVRADDSGRMVDLMRDVVRAQNSQVDALKNIARAAERCTK